MCGFAVHKPFGSPSSDKKLLPTLSSDKMLYWTPSSDKKLFGDPSLNKKLFEFPSSDKKLFELPSLTNPFISSSTDSVKRVVHTNPRLNLLGLSIELRMMIYRLVLVQNEPILKMPVNPLALTSTCRTIQQEAKDIFWHQNVFKIQIQIQMQTRPSFDSHSRCFTPYDLGPVSDPTRKWIWCDRAWTRKVKQIELEIRYPEKNGECQIPYSNSVVEDYTHDLRAALKHMSNVQSLRVYLIPCLHHLGCKHLDENKSNSPTLQLSQEKDLKNYRDLLRPLGVFQINDVAISGHCENYDRFLSRKMMQQGPLTPSYEDMLFSLEDLSCLSSLSSIIQGQRHTLRDLSEHNDADRLIRMRHHALLDLSEARIDQATAAKRLLLYDVKPCPSAHDSLLVLTGDDKSNTLEEYREVKKQKEKAENDRKRKLHEKELREQKIQLKKRKQKIEKSKRGQSRRRGTKEGKARSMRETKLPILENQFPTSIPEIEVEAEERFAQYVLETCGAFTLLAIGIKMLWMICSWIFKVLCRIFG